MKKLNPTEAPPGYRARTAADGIYCPRCAFRGLNPQCRSAPCCSIERTDDCRVYFVKSPKRPHPAAKKAQWSTAAHAKRLARTLCTAKQRPPTIEGWIEWAAYRIERAWLAECKSAKQGENQ